MKRKTITCYLLILFFCSFVTAQKKQLPEQQGLQVINQTTAEAYIGFLASDELEGREAGFRGGRIAANYLVATLQAMGIRPLFEESYYQPFEAYNYERQQRKRFQVHPDSIALIKQNVHQKLSMRNVLGMIEGKNRDEYVIVGAHYDHLGIDPVLHGDQIYNGADDNASGVSAVLQIAQAFLATGVQPERSVIFAFWDGEEKGLLGSKYFTHTFPQTGKVKAYLNFDMIGRNNDESDPTHVVYFYTEAHPVFESWLKEDIRKYELNLSPVYRPWDRPIGGSDNASFAVLDIPVIWYHTDGHPDYHMPTDHTDRINWQKLVDITKASFLTMWRLANQTDF
ncbi:MAG: M20/M25/M40 family metallo-hydrolase [Tannerellaceae bacterium]|nr:M20/M25/M40 family metallo-hydrolase [Tannerellaceae bacterium]